MGESSKLLHALNTNEIWKILFLTPSFLFYSSFQLIVVKPKPKQLQWPIPSVNNRTNQSELEANTRNRRQAWENACDHVVAICFSFVSDYLSRWREFFKLIIGHSIAKLWWPKQLSDYFQQSIENRPKSVEVSYF